MTRRLAVATGVTFAVVALLGAIGNSPFLELIGITLGVVCFTIALWLKESGIR